jgi:hypothetical protein
MYDADAVLAVYREETREPFEFKLGGRVWRVPHVADVKIGQSIALDHGDYRPLIQLARRVDEQGNEHDGYELYGLILGLTSAQWSDLIYVPWLTHGGLKPGESPASSPS